MSNESRTPGTAVPRSRLTPRTSLGAPRRESLGGTTPGRSALKTPSRFSSRVPITASANSPDDKPSIRPASSRLMPKRSATFAAPRRTEGRPSLGREGRPSLGRERRPSLSREGRPSLGRDTESRLITPKKLSRPAPKTPAPNMTPSQIRAEAARKRREAAEADAAASKSRRSSAVGVTDAPASAKTPSQIRQEASRKRREAVEADTTTARRSSGVGALEAGKIIGGRRTRTPVAKPGTPRLGDRGVSSSSTLPSPQTRRATGGAANHRTSLLARRRASGGGVASSVSRKLAMPTEEIATPVNRPRTLKSPSRNRAEAMNKISSMTNGSHRMEDMPQHTVTPRAGAKAESALESFRKVRRESLEQNHMVEKNASERPVAERNDDTVNVSNTRNSKELPDRPDPAGELGAPVGAPGRSGGLVASDILGRADTPVRTKRVSARFSDADLCLDSVDKLRLSIGRRRSRGGADLSAITTPTLNRSQQRETVDDVTDSLGRITVADGGSERTPLRALREEGEEGNGEEEEVKCKPVRLSLTKSPMKAFHLEDTALTWAECDDDDMLDR